MPQNGESAPQNPTGGAFPLSFALPILGFPWGASAAREEWNIQCPATSPELAKLEGLGPSEANAPLGIISHLLALSKPPKVPGHQVPPSLTGHPLTNKNMTGNRTAYFLPFLAHSLKYFSLLSISFFCFLGFMIFSLLLLPGRDDWREGRASPVLPFSHPKFVDGFLRRSS